MSPYNDWSPQRAKRFSGSWECPRPDSCKNKLKRCGNADLVVLMGGTGIIAISPQVAARTIRERKQPGEASSNYEYDKRRPIGCAANSAESSERSVPDDGSERADPRRNHRRSA